MEMGMQVQTGQAADTFRFSVRFTYACIVCAGRLLDCLLVASVGTLQG